MKHIYTLITIITLSIFQISATILSTPGNCNPDEACEFICINPSSCEDGSLNCAAGQPCKITCGAEDACKTANIFANDATTLEVECSDKSSCGDAMINGEGADIVTVSCEASDSCKGETTIYCGEAKCSVACTFDDTSCEDLTIDRSMTKSFECIGEFCEFIGSIITFQPTKSPTKQPTASPSKEPTMEPTTTEPTTSTASPMQVTQAQQVTQAPQVTTTEAPVFYSFNAEKSYDNNDVNDVNNDNDTKDIVISFSKYTMTNIWILVAAFFVINGLIVYFCCFRFKDKQNVSHRERVNSNV